jgi:hypothetical protein
MTHNRIRTIVRTAAGTALMAGILGASAVGVAGMANAAPAHAPQAVHAPQDICWYTYHPELGAWPC